LFDEELAGRTRRIHTPAKNAFDRARCADTFPAGAGGVRLVANDVTPAAVEWVLVNVWADEAEGRLVEAHGGRATRARSAGLPALRAPWTGLVGTENGAFVRGSASPTPAATEQPETGDAGTEALEDGSPVDPSRHDSGKTVESLVVHGAPPAVALADRSIRTALGGYREL
jgi:hypothetical protein